jgi:hypothetical protein
MQQRSTRRGWHHRPDPPTRLGPPQSGVVLVHAPTRGHAGAGHRSSRHHYACPLSARGRVKHGAGGSRLVRPILLLAARVAAVLSTVPVRSGTDRFPDGELRPRVAEVRGEDVYVVQPTRPPVTAHVVELLLLLGACRRVGVERLTAVVPYFGYARQDRRGRPGDAVGARVLASALAAGADRLVAVHRHTDGSRTKSGPAHRVVRTTSQAAR